MPDWMYKCYLGLTQGKCGENYKHDRFALGRKWSGCPSCTHRIPSSTTTTTRDDQSKDHQIVAEQQ